MLKFAQASAKKIYPFRNILAVIGAGLFAFFLYLIFQNDPEMDKFFLPVAVCAAWVVCLMGIASYFRLVPDLPETKVGFFLRIKIKFHRAIAWFWAVCFTLCSVILLYMSLRSIFYVLNF